MKKLVWFFSQDLKSFISDTLFIVISLLLFSGCNSIDDNIIINPPVDIPDTLGNVIGYINSYDGPVEDAYITLDNKITFWDSNGFFEFKDCVKKILVITISHPEFSEYSNSISITDSLRLDVALTRIKYDYFPLKVGNHWKYHWTNSWYASGGGGGNSAGTIYWDIVGVVGVYPNFVYKIKETRFDSTYNTSNETYINIQTNLSDSIKVLDLGYILKSPVIRRYYPTSYQDTVYVFGYENSTTKLKRSNGVIQCYYGYGGITYGSFTNIEMISYELY
jgi:hypothetical protein